MGRTILLLAALVWLLGGCAGSQPKGDEKQQRIVVTPQMYKVRRGDTLSSIAWRYQLDYRSLAQWNKLSAPYTIHPGQRLVLNPPPGWVGIPPLPKGDYPKVGEQVPTSRPVAKTYPYTPPPAAPVASGTAATSPVAKPAPRTSATPAAPIRPTPEPMHWIWPTKGKIVRGFEPGRSSGVDIAGVEGQSVVAAAAGEVVYSGSALKGYGELIIIRHTENILSAYGHNRRRYVVEGEKIRQGQLIAEMGSTDAKVPLLHFEIRYNGKPVDPRRYLAR